MARRILSLSAHFSHAVQGLDTPTLSQEVACKTSQIEEAGNFAAAATITKTLLDNISQGIPTENWRLVAIQSEQSLKDYIDGLAVRAEAKVMQSFIDARHTLGLNQ